MTKNELENLLDQLYEQVRKLKVSSPEQMAHYYKEQVRVQLIARLKLEEKDGNDDSEKK